MIFVFFCSTRRAQKKKRGGFAHFYVIIATEFSMAPSPTAPNVVSFEQMPEGAKVQLEFDTSYANFKVCLLYTSPSPRDLSTSRMPSSA